VTHVTIISTGEELVTGHAVDTNASFLASRLTAHGYEVRRLACVGDDPESLERELVRSADDSELIVVTGGLGPTADDRTRVAIARATGAELVLDEDSLEHVRRVIESYGHKITESHARQALFPAGAEIYPNHCGTARGFACLIGKAKAVMMPGVPNEMISMFNDSVLPSLLKDSTETILVRRANLFGVPESQVDDRIEDLMANGRNPSVGLKAEGGVVGICLYARASDMGEAERLIAEDLRVVRDRFGDDVFGYDDTTLGAAVSGLLEQHGVRVAIAESCTGGLIGSMLTEVPGISRFFLLDVVAYSNEAKIRELRVPAEEIESFGAASPQVAESMARGVCEMSGAELGISATGIAGPNGGTPEKPVGMVCVGLSLDGRTTSHVLQFRGDRQRIRDRAAKSALNLARLALLKRSGPD
jgi:nicotinamide-nucleotide amidase